MQVNGGKLQTARSAGGSEIAICAVIAYGHFPVVSVLVLSVNRCSDCPRLYATRRRTRTLFLSIFFMLRIEPP